jgi:hypothetical protein
MVKNTTMEHMQESYDLARDFVLMYDANLKL